MTRTTQQVLRDQEVQAEREREEKNAVAIVSKSDGWREVAHDRPNGNHIRGSLLKFIDGKWYAGSAEVPLGTRMIAVGCQSLWLRWENQKPVESVERNAEGRLPPRAELSLYDKSEWPLDKTGTPADPWASTIVVHLIHATNGGVFTFSTSSLGGRGACMQLADEIDYVRQAKPDAIPLVELQSAPMPTRYGLKSKPRFVVVGWQGGTVGDSVKQIAPPSTSELMNDSIDF